jgi:peptide/nickel transport system substrate-binding protein
VIDDGALGDKQYAYVGNQYAPDFDMFIWGWGGDVDPNFILSILTTGSIEAWSDCIWSNAEYDKLFLLQQTQIDLQQRIATVQKMQQIVYAESPYIPLVYPLDLEVADTTNWTGWVRANQNKGAWWYNTQPDTYMAVQKGAAVVATKSSNTGMIVAVVIGVIVVLAIILLLVLRRGRRSEVEA